jgi:hypothetical protein
VDRRLVVTALLLSWVATSRSPAQPTASGSHTSPRAVRPATPLAFRDFFEPTPRELKPSAKLVALNGQRVRIVGFMAHMEEPVHGAFYLCPRPTECAEGGAGTGDLPASAVRVILPGPPDRALPFNPQALEVVGRLELGPRTETDGQVTSIRIFLDPPARATGKKRRPSTRGTAGTPGAKRASWQAR